MLAENLPPPHSPHENPYPKTSNLVDTLKIYQLFLPPITSVSPPHTSFHKFFLQSTAVPKSLPPAAPSMRGAIQSSSFSALSVKASVPEQVRGPFLIFGRRCTCSSFPKI
ncbi:hypothetical protein NPIL_47411 [Nephila pilipes]|uniref:Uncharacterized protein n=1 Tax=Nephila pilipes TaxID=299642 RepID=A0A8X6QV54_NEPPI|nr:hypothetical protein NPIL_47411 [Nephila pilipes]